MQPVTRSAGRTTSFVELQKLLLPAVDLLVDVGANVGQVFKIVAVG